MENGKMIRTAGKLDKVFKILQGIIVGCLAACVILLGILTVVNRINPNAITASEFTMVDLGIISVEVADAYVPDSMGIVAYGWMVLALGCTNGIIVWFCLKYIRNILEPMKQGNPFQKEVSGNLKKLAWIVLAMGIIRNIVKTIAAMVIISKWNLTELPQTEAIRSVQPNIDLELGFLLVFFGLLLMSYIFRYGASLQQLSDETL